MKLMKSVTAILFFFPLSTALADPILSVAPGAMEAGNFVWEVGIAPDLILALGDTAMAVELGFRLTGAPLLSATNINPSEWDTPTPGAVIFGWETLTDLGPGPDLPVGLQVNTATDEVFVAFGSVVFNTPGNKPFLKIITDGAGFTSSTIEWLGAYTLGNGRISQAVGRTAANFDNYSGSAVQAVPESANAIAATVAGAALIMGLRRRAFTRFFALFGKPAAG